jgi:tetratricopeptide (TPR) repeat protein
MEAYEVWLSDQPVYLSIMHLIGLFDRPANSNCLRSLRKRPSIQGVTDQLVGLNETAWRRAVYRLRELSLISPEDKSNPDALDTHPLVRAWFGDRLRQKNETAWKAAHSRLYDHLRRTANEGDSPSIERLMPLYQAVIHGCQGDRHEECFTDIYIKRIAKRDFAGTHSSHSWKKLGAAGADLACLSWFFDRPYEIPSKGLPKSYWPWLLNMTGIMLRAQGRLSDALTAQREGFLMDKERAEDLSGSPRSEIRALCINAGISASSLSETELMAGETYSAIETAKLSVTLTKRGGDHQYTVMHLTALGDALQTAGQRDEAQAVFRTVINDIASLASLQGYRTNNFLLAEGNWRAVRSRAEQTLPLSKHSGILLDIGLSNLALARAIFGEGLECSTPSKISHLLREAHQYVEEALDCLRIGDFSEWIVLPLLARSGFRRALGDWDGARNDLNEVEEICSPGPFQLYLCAVTIERARLALAQSEAFAPLGWVSEHRQGPAPMLPGAVEITRFGAEAAGEVIKATKIIEQYGYKKRREELLDLESVLSGRRRYSALPSTIIHFPIP